MVSSAVRGVVVTLLGVWFFHEIITTYVSNSSPFTVHDKATLQGARCVYLDDIDGIHLLYLGQKRGSESQRRRKRASKGII